MSGGVGRGRGWLNLKLQGTKTPGSETNTSPPIINNLSSPNFNSQDNRKFSDLPNDYTDLISKIKQLNINDDGIKFNQKIKYIIESWNQDCQNAVDVEKSFDAIHEASLTDTDTATKLVLLIASRTFLSQTIHEQNIRLMFVRKLQENFESSAHLQSSNSTQFRNSVQLMGEFFNKARLAGGGQFTFMVPPLLTYLEMLLDSVEADDYRLFTTQLYLNGSSFKEQCPEKVAEVLIKTRLTLCSDENITKEGKLWLLLALDVSNNRFSLLPADIHKFYQEQLGDLAMACFQGSHSTLTVQTESKTLDNVQSDVNVLQVSSEAPASQGAPAVNNSVPDLGSSMNNYNSSGFQSDTSQNSVVINKDNHLNSNKGGKSGRPILGAGARLQKNRNQTVADSSDSWDSTTDKSQNDSAASNWNRNRSSQNNSDSSSGNWQKNKPQKDGTTESNWRDRDNKKQGNDQGNQKKDWEKKKTPAKVKKGWEHDDRFDTDYS